ncbi:MAG: ABC-type transport auxiliary lipoprotein family protein [Desulfobacterales bacterium]|nr:ABC-type transport auxiliary lipoprotein family protein [Desulfobacterales bacterium]
MKPDKIIFFLLLIMFCAGCLNFKQPGLQINYYALEYNPPVIDKTPLLSEVIQIRRFQTSPFYDTRNIIYTEKEFTRKPYHYHRWQATPGDMVSTLLARDFMSYNIFSAVITDISALNADYVLEGKVDDFYEVDEPDHWKAVLSVNITFSRKNSLNASGGILLQKSYAVTEICNKKSPDGLAAALSLAMSDISQNIANDVYAIVSLY